MELFPVTAAEYLPHIMRAAEASGYAGLMVVLARTADARPQHEELTRDWTSLHFVTGSLLAVLCPDPDASGHRSAVKGGPLGRAAGVPGLHLEHQSWQRQNSFQHNFWDKQARLDFSQSKATRSAEAHHAAWTEAASLCARFFGFAEAQLPSVLILSFWDETGVLIRLQPTITLYSFAKALAERFDDKLRKIDQMESEIEDLQESYRELQGKQSSWVSRNRLYLRWSSKLKNIEYLLGQSDGLDPALVARCQDGLRRMRESRQVGTLPNDLRYLHGQLKSQYPRGPLRHSAVWGLICELEAGGPFPVPTHEFSPYVAQLEDIPRTIRDARAQEMSLRGNMRLAEAVVRNVTGYSVPSPLPSRAELLA